MRTVSLQRIMELIMLLIFLLVTEYLGVSISNQVLLGQVIQLATSHVSFLLQGNDRETNLN